MPELRKDPITGRWVIIATDRAKRPTDFVREHVVRRAGFCPFCPGNESKTPPEVLAYRPSGGGPNEPGWSLRVVPNKFPALRVEGDSNRLGDGLYDRMNGIGAHEVIIETPDHMLTLGDLTDKQVEDVFWAFRDRILDLRKDIAPPLHHRLQKPRRGGRRLAGARPFAAHRPAGRAQARAGGTGRRQALLRIQGALHLLRHHPPGNGDGKRIILETEHFVAFAPYASRFPFETWILPKRHISHFENIEIPEVQNLGWMLRAVIRKIDKVLDDPPTTS